jgi:hypothetical protein
MRTQEEILAALETIILSQRRAIVLLKSEGKSTDAAKLFRTYMQEKDLGHLLKPEGLNPDFVKLGNGSWVFFLACVELDPSEDVGHPDFIVWPTKDGVYAVVTHRDWRLLRAKEQDPWRPPDAFEEPLNSEDGENSVWSQLTANDDIG